MLRILNLKANKVHGYIPLNLKFDDQLTFLTGSNGSGKTTALKLISAILQPNFELIDSIDFESVILIFSIEGQKYTVKFEKVKDRQINESIIWSIQPNANRKEPSLELPINSKGTFKLYPKFHRVIYDREEISTIRENTYLDFVNSDYFKIIQGIQSPVFLGIDRRLFGSITNSDRKIHQRSLPGNFTLSERSYFDAQRVIVDYVSSMADKKKQYSEQFKLNIFKSLFEYVEFDEKKAIFTRLKESDLQLKKNNVLKAIQKLDLGEEISGEIEKYYNSIADIQPKVFDVEIDQRKTEEVNEWFINRSHLHRIEAISKHAEHFQKKIDELDRPLTEIERLANKFFIESNKSLRINVSGYIQVDWSNQKITTQNLSSGEIQIIVLLVHLVFCEFRKDSSVFVIDEPELSLHLSWQEKFVEAIIEASPSTQFILATHSPAIISKFEYEEKAIYIKNI